MKIAKRLTDLIGNTPLLEFSGLKCFNPLSLGKDRVGYAMNQDA